MQPQTAYEILPPTAATNDEALLTSSHVRDLCGGVSLMCIWRWQRDPKVAFPPPDVVINSRRYWYRRTIRAWQTSRRAIQKAS